MQLAWLTDIHLNFLDADARKEFYKTIIAKNCDAILISGDIDEAPTLADKLKEMAIHVQKPIYFVLGNHDYYHGEITAVKNKMEMLTKTEKLLYWLPASNPQHLKNDTVLLGQDGWADGRYGDYANSKVVLNDSRMITDLFQQKILGKNFLLTKMQALADKDARSLLHDITRALKEHQPKKIIVLTHVPPFREACKYEGKISNDDYLPFFSSKATGEALLHSAKINSSVEFLVLCGHTHGASRYRPLENLMVKTGQAEYFQPSVQEIIEI